MESYLYMLCLITLLSSAATVANVQAIRSYGNEPAVEAERFSFFEQ